MRVRLLRKYGREEWYEIDWLVEEIRTSLIYRTSVASPYLRFHQRVFRDMAQEGQTIPRLRRLLDSPTKLSAFSTILEQDRLRLPAHVSLDQLTSFRKDSAHTHFTAWMDRALSEPPSGDDAMRGIRIPEEIATELNELASTLQERVARSATYGSLFVSGVVSYLAFVYTNPYAAVAAGLASAAPLHHAFSAVLTHYSPFNFCFYFLRWRRPPKGLTRTRTSR